MEIKYQIPFKSRLGTNYVVNIYDENWTGFPIQLKGAAQPFVTQEDDDDDAFKPVRTQTGYIRIVDDGTGLDLTPDEDPTRPTDHTVQFDWNDLIPQNAVARFVTLTHEETIGGITSTYTEWRGFIQPQSFSGQMYEGVQEREFPVCCVLSVLASFDVDPTANTVTNFAGLLVYLFNHLGEDAEPWFYVFQGTGSTSETEGYVDSWLKKRVMWSNFADTDEDGNITAKYNCLELLEEICTFFGWTARTNYNNVFFFRVGEQTAFRNFSIDNLTRLANDETSYPMTETQQAGTFSTDFASKNNIDTIMRGWRKVTVEADVNKLSKIVEYPAEEIYNYYKSYTLTREGLYHFLFKKAGIFNVDQPTGIFDFREVYLKFRASNQDAYWGSPYIYGKDPDNANPHDVQLNNVAYIEKGMPARGADKFLMRMKTKNQYWLNDGLLVISAKCYIDGYDTSSGTDITYTAAGYLIIALKVGEKYAEIHVDSTGRPDSVTWVDSYADFPVGTGTNDNPDPQQETQGQGQIQSTRLWNDPYPSYNGFGIPINQQIGGPVELRIIHFHDAFPPAGSSANERGVCITDLKLEFFRKNSDNDSSENNKNKYIADGNVLFTETREVRTIFATDKKNAFGHGLILNPNGSYCDGISYVSGGRQHPEQNLANRMAAFGATTHHVLETEVHQDWNEIPKQEQTFAIGSKRYDTIAVSREWRDDVTKAKFMQVG